MSEEYTIKEVLEQRFNEMNTHLVDIKTQTTKTNGRVGVLENHKAYLWGAISVVTVLGGAIIALAISAIDAKIKVGVDTAFNSRFDKIEVTH